VSVGAAHSFQDAGFDRNALGPSVAVSVADSYTLLLSLRKGIPLAFSCRCRCIPLPFPAVPW
jgi:hypothetical protein